MQARVGIDRDSEHTLSVAGSAAADRLSAAGQASRDDARGCGPSGGIPGIVAAVMVSREMAGQRA